MNDYVQRLRAAQGTGKPAPRGSGGGVTPRAPRPAAVDPVSRRGLLLKSLGAAGLASVLGGGTVAYAANEAASDLRITRYKLSPPAWPKGRKLTIAVVADLHAAGPNMGVGRVTEVVDRTNMLGCDIILLLGDYVAHHHFITHTVPNHAWAEELARLRAPLGVHAIFGNHDWWHGIESVRRALAAVKIPAMENDAVLLGGEGNRFWLAGLGCTIAHRLGHGQFRGVDDLPGTMAKITTDDPVILMVHEPDAFTRVPERVALTLAGHTHGGQIRVPVLWKHWVPSQFGARFAYGHIVEDNRHMIVSGGLGTSIVPMRLGVPPEILRVELSA
jgi:predicted MPP superfamily phosphohydrolase